MQQRKLQGRIAAKELKEHKDLNQEWSGNDRKIDGRKIGKLNTEH